MSGHTGRSDDEILTSREACELLKIGRTKLWQLTRDNAIPAYRVGKARNSDLRYKRSELLEWLDGMRVDFVAGPRRRAVATRVPDASLGGRES